MVDQQTIETDERKPVEFRFHSIDGFGTVRLDEALVYCKVTRCRGTWERELPLEIVEPFPTRYTFTPGIVWLIAGLALFAMTFGVLSLVDRDMGMMNPATAMALVVTCLFLICFAWYHRRVVWVVFPTDSNNHYIVFCSRGPDAARFDEFMNTFIQRIKVHRGSCADEQSDACADWQGLTDERGEIPPG